MLLLVASMVYKSATGCATYNVDCVATDELVLNFTEAGVSPSFLGLVRVLIHAHVGSIDVADIGYLYHTCYTNFHFEKSAT